MVIKDPIDSNIVGPAQTIEEKAALFLYLAKDSLRKNPEYSLEMIGYALKIYSNNNLPLPEKIALEIKNLKNMLKR